VVTDAITAHTAALEELSRLLRTASVLLDKRIGEHLDGISVAQWHALAALSAGELLSMSALQAATQLSGASLTRLVDGMVDSNLALRKVGDLDRRHVLVAATRRGLATYRQHREQLEALGDDMFGPSAANLADALKDVVTQLSSRQEIPS
jgi:DNA-binding MarR family transcriptional regulator